MKLQSLAEAVINKAALKKDAAKASAAEKAADLGPHAQKVWAAKTFDEKKKHAHTMADQFKVGGKDDFKTNIEKCKTPNDIDKLVSNAMLKGEGKGTSKR